MRVNIEQLENQRLEVTARDSTLIVDLPSDQGGAEGAFVSGELFLASLGACMLGTLIQAADFQGVKVEGVSIELEAETTTRPQRMDTINVTLQLPADVPEAKLSMLVRSASKCKIHNTLAQPPAVQITARVGEQVLAV